MRSRQPCQREAEARLSSGPAIAVPAITISFEKLPLHLRAASTQGPIAATQPYLSYRASANISVAS